ncbi:SIFamide-related peptide [Copidosoma floridanum]|uniref:SIFamide-related peptide n=1 Tax=Copidosoma floridanum TaxID=29053 RepID=UPI0006C94E54|nr:SIFamide-related peptide [Copidosoma floridanum]XP_014203252.1 SIFamide-related peptide [Copidosoma floridanum]
MSAARFMFVLFVVVAVAILDVSSAAYRKPPFNGSIFGKRANTITDYDVASRAMDAICEIARDNCNAWYSHQDSN